MTPAEYESKIAKLERENSRYRACIKSIADHHEEMRQQCAYDYSLSSYHTERRDRAMFTLTCPEARGETPLLEVE